MSQRSVPINVENIECFLNKLPLPNTSMLCVCDCHSDLGVRQNYNESSQRQNMEFAALPMAPFSHLPVLRLLQALHDNDTCTATATWRVLATGARSCHATHSCLTLVDLDDTVTAYSIDAYVYILY